MDYEKKDFKEGRRYFFLTKALEGLFFTSLIVFFVCQAFLALNLIANLVNKTWSFFFIINLVIFFYQLITIEPRKRKQTAPMATGV